MRLQNTYKKLENDCFNLLTFDPNPPHDLNHFSLILRLENTLSRVVPGFADDSFGCRNKDRNDRGVHIEHALLCPNFSIVPVDRLQSSHARKLPHIAGNQNTTVH